MSLVHRGDSLFDGGELRAYLEAKRSEAAKAVWALPEADVSCQNEDALVSRVLQAFQVRVPAIVRASVEMYPPDIVDIDGGRILDIAMFLDADEEAQTVKGIAATFRVPFDGTAELFRYQPSTRGGRPLFVDAKVLPDHLELTFEDPRSDLEVIRKRLDETLLSLNEKLQWVRSDVDSHWVQVTGEVAGAVRARKQQLSKVKEQVKQLGIPIRSRPAEERPFIPVKRKPTSLTHPTKEAGHFTDPGLPEEVFEDILRVMGSMGLAMERSPSAFSRLKEEHLRDFFLVYLNGTYEGAATGETFSVAGKTDIRLLHEGKAAFIAECKFWHGEKMLHEAFDQLMGYLSWRDTKNALVIFNRDTELTRVISTIEKTIPSTKGFRKRVSKPQETEIRYEFDHPQDNQRSLQVAVLVYQVPVEK